MRQFTIDYINENGSDSGDLELESGDYYTVVYIEKDHVWVYGGVCNVGLIPSGYYQCEEWESKDEGLNQICQDLEMLDSGSIPSDNFYQYN